MPEPDEVMTPDGGTQVPVESETADQQLADLVPESSEEVAGAEPAEGEIGEAQEEEKEQVSDEEPQKPKTKKDVQKRIDELVRRRYQLEARNEQLEAELQSLRQQLLQLTQQQLQQQQQPQPTPKHAGMPKQEDFDTYEDWVQAVAEYKAEQKVREALMRAEAERAMREQQAAQAQAAARWAEAVEQARKRYEDFDEVVSVNVPIPQAAFTAILDSPVGPDIAYYLGKNPDVVRKLNSMVNNPAAVYREIGKLEALLERSNPGTSAKTTPKPKPKPTATPVSKAGTAPLASRKSPDEMTYQEYKAWREEQIAKKRGLR